MFSYDIIKILLSDEGYLPDYPPHLIGDDEMCKAFLAPKGEDAEFQYFVDNYYLADGLGNDNKMTDAYKTLQTAIRYHLCRASTSVEEFNIPIPNWVQAYMFGAVVSHNSSQQDKHWMLTQMNEDNIDDVITPQIQSDILDASYNIIRQYDNSVRKVTLSQCMSGVKDEHRNECEEELSYWGVLDNLRSDSGLDSRPPFMFGELSFIKYLRVRASA